MRQVPHILNSRPLLLIGSGRLAQSLSYYFDLEKIAFHLWSRRNGNLKDLQQKIDQAETVLLAISDSSLESFIEEHDLQDKTCVHFSGTLTVKAAWSFHPLMTFSEETLSPETLRSMHFVLQEGSPSLNILGLKNPFSYLANDKRALYHALCAMSGNFSVLLWEYTIQRFEKDLGLKGEVLKPYLHKIFENLGEVASDRRLSVLTGPLARGDFGTIEKHLSALQGDPMKQVYEAFVSAYQQRNSHEKHS